MAEVYLLKLFQAWFNYLSLEMHTLQKHSVACFINSALVLNSEQYNTLELASILLNCFTFIYRLEVRT